MYRNTGIGIGSGDKVTFLVTSRRADRKKQAPRQTILLADRAGPGVVSIESPIGKALEGSSVGKTVTVKAPGGHYRIKITNVEHTVKNKN